MIKIGKRQKLKINNFASVGAYLDAETGDSNDNILLPNNELEGKELKEGDEVEVLIYMDSEDRPVATFRKTEALVGTLAKLEVTDIHPTLGAFMDWGLTKDLLLPKKQQEIEVELGKKYLVGIYEDSKGRLSATMRIYKFLLPSTAIEKNDIVNGTVYRINPEIGVFVAVEDRYFGLIPKNEYFREYKVGDEIEARVIRVREDGKLDLSSRELSYIQADKDAELILEKMRLLKDSFRFTDKSSSEEIVDYFNMSKKAFKRAMGGLLKSQKVEKTEDGFFRLKK
ncbi:S1 RNA-binding domain-containing protein [Fusobacterium sp.]|uniref:CvfB family protein n=1 Tax=Fusobacterium sp. TaxID=68766 RepID=UPI00396CF214